MSRTVKWEADEQYQLVNICHALRIALAIRNRSIESLAESAGMHAGSLSRLLGNKSDDSNPQLITIIRLAKALGLSLEQLVNLPNNSREMLGVTE